MKSQKIPLCSKISLLSFSSSDIRTYFESVILANHTEPLRAMVAFLFRERHPGRAGQTLHFENRHG
ncbi:hypothetical protein ABES02_28535 [Neobacillus pocheonensis]|uniref:hypothetical protein n=1 Tax=Neobacillus pocheonensis TaxID=363869 RepID=UPI003D2DC964